VLAERSYAAGDSWDARLTSAFRRAVCRAPSANDLTLLRRALDRQLAIYQADTAATQALLAVGESKTKATLPPAEHAAFTSVCLAILNLDEALTRE
jgi:hypothetical protein